MPFTPGSQQCTAKINASPPKHLVSQVTSTVDDKTTYDCAGVFSDLGSKKQNITLDGRDSN